MLKYIYRLKFLEVYICEHVMHFKVYIKFTIIMYNKYIMYNKLLQINYYKFLILLSNSKKQKH